MIFCNACQQYNPMQQQQKSYDQQQPTQQPVQSSQANSVPSDPTTHIQSLNIDTKQQHNTDSIQQYNEQKVQVEAGVDLDGKQGEQSLTVQYRQIDKQKIQPIENKSKMNSVSDRALQLVHRMVRERRDRERQLQAKHQIYNNNTTIVNNNISNTKINSHKTIQHTLGKIGNIRKNIDHELPSSTGVIRRNRMYASIDVGSLTHNYNLDSYEDNRGNMRRSLNIGKIVKVHKNYDISSDKTRLYEPYYPESPHYNNKPPNFTNLPPLPLHTRNPIINSPMVYEKQRQLYILDKSKRMTELYQLKKYVTHIIFDICDEAVERIEQKRTFFSYRIHRRIYGKTQSKQQLNDPIFNLVNKFSETIHPKHERTLQSANNLHEALMMSRVRKQKDGQVNGEEEKSRRKQKGASRIQPVFSYTFNIIDEGNQDDGQQNEGDDENSDSSKQNSEEQQSNKSSNSQKNSESQSQSKNQSESVSEKQDDKQSSHSSQSSATNSISSNRSSHNQDRNDNKSKLDQTVTKQQSEDKKQTEQLTTVIEQKKQEQSKIPITHQKQTKIIPKLNSRKGLGKK